MENIVSDEPTIMIIISNTVFTHLLVVFLLPASLHPHQPSFQTQRASGLLFFSEIAHY